MTVTCDVLVDDPRWTERMDVEAVVNSAVEKVLQATNAKLRRDAEASFSFSTDERVRQLNSTWRHKDAPTNVLSFPAAESASLETSPLLGDVIMAYETIDREAIEEGKLFVHHASHMIVHGFLHLIGFDHEDEEEARDMENVESRVLTELGVPDPWAAQDDDVRESET